MTGNASYLSKAKFPVAFFVNGIGDAFMLLPTLRALANCYHGKLILLCDKSFEQWWFKELNLKAIVGITVNRSKTNFPIIYQSEILEILKGCDVFFSLIFWRSRNLLNLIKKLNNNHIITVGAFDEYKLVVKNMQDLHVIDASFEFAHMVNKSLDVKEYSYPLILSNESAQIAKGLKKNFFLIQKILIVHADTKKNKMWSCNNFSRVINKFLKKTQGIRRINCWLYTFKIRARLRKVKDYFLL
jgi:hypothetical protein